MPVKPRKANVSPQREAESAATRQRIVDLLLENKSQNEISRIMGISAGAVSRHISLIREEWSQRRALSYEQHVDAAIKRLHTAADAVWSRALDGDLDAMDRWIKLFSEEARVCGYYAPANVKVITSSVVDEEIEKLNAEIALLGADGD